MNVDQILETLNRHQVAYLLVGGMNFLLRHAPIATYDVDIWIEDTDVNRARCEAALADLSAEWGQSNADWGPVAARSPGWLALQGVYCLSSPYGSIDVFRSVKGLADWRSSFQQAVLERTVGGVEYYGLSDAHMLECQLALDPGQQKQDRIRVLRARLSNPP